MSKVRLVLSPLESYKAEEGIIFIGEWCRNKIGLSKIASVDYRWDNRDTLYSDYCKILSLYEKYLERLSQSLNAEHGVNYGMDYWRIVVGPWLFHFLSIVFERYYMLKKAEDENSINEIVLPKYNRGMWVPLEYVDFNLMFSEDGWNYYLYSEIVKFLDRPSCSIGDFRLENTNQFQRRKESIGKKVVKSLFYNITKIIPKRFKKILFLEVNIPQRVLSRMLIILKLFPVSYYVRVQPRLFPLNQRARSNLLISTEKEDEFDKLMYHLISHNIPISYLEGYNDLQQEAKGIFPDEVKIAVTSNAYFSNEHFKFWIAHQQFTNKTKLLVSVHGGHHGTAKFNGSGKLTEDIADRFYAWGWGQYNLPSPRLSMLRNEKLKREGNDILFVMYDLSKYSNHIDASPISSTYLKCFEMHRNFFLKLRKSPLLDKIVVRIKSRRGIEIDDWNFIDEYKKIGIKKFAFSGEVALLDSLRRASIVVVTYDSTVLLETFTLNIPTCLFFKTEHWEPSEIAVKYYERLVNCGVLHHDEDSLYEHITSVQSSIEEWWYSSDVQQAVNLFLEKFGMSSDNWVDEWIGEIQSHL